MKSMILRRNFLITISIICFVFVSSNVTIFCQEARKIPYLPLVYDVTFPPTPLKGEGGIHLIYELHMTNFYRSEITLYRIDVLGEGGATIKTYEGTRLSECITRPGKPLNLEDKLSLEGGSRAVLFIMVTFDNLSDVPDSLSHQVTIRYVRRSGEEVLLQGEGAETSVVRQEPIVIGPPVRSDMWLAGNCTGDGPVGHRNSLQSWNGRLVVSQRYAIDFMKFGNDNRFAHGDSSINSNWYTYGEELLAVADAIVSDVKDGIIENTPLADEYAVPRTMEYAVGNYVILEIGPECYAVYAHLKPGGVLVKVGDRVRKGQVIGLVGNSGISDAPHLHFHIINSNSVVGGEGLPFVFETFELMGTFDSLDDNLTNPWVQKTESTMRYKEIPLGDVVIKFLKSE
jgi:murein DD-endopeptidase